MVRYSYFDGGVIPTVKLLFPASPGPIPLKIVGLVWHCLWMCGSYLLCYYPCENDVMFGYKPVIVFLCHESVK